MGSELGTAYVSILPSTKDLGKTLKRDVDKASSVAGQSGSKKVGAAFENLKGNLNSLLNGADKLAVRTGIAGAALVGVGTGIEKVMSRATSTAKEYGSEVLLLQRLTGASAEESSRWAAILGRYNVTGAKAGLVVKSLSSAIASNSEALTSVGIATRNADGSNRTSMEVLADLAEKYKNADDKTEILAVGTRALGRGFVALLPLLASGKDGIEALGKAAEENGLIFSDADIAAVKEYNGALKANEQAVKGAQVQVGLATLPFETWKTRSIGETFKALRDLNPEVSRTAGTVGSVIGPVTKLAGQLLLGAAAFPFVRAGIRSIAGVAATAGFSATELSLGIRSVGSGVNISRLYAAGGALRMVAVGAYAATAALGVGLGFAINAGMQKIPGYQQTINNLYESLRDFNPLINAFKDDTGLSWFDRLFVDESKLAVATTAAERAQMVQNGTVTQATALVKSQTTATEDVTAATDAQIRSINGLLVAQNSLGGSARTAKEAQIDYGTALLDSRAARKEVTRLEDEGKQGTDEHTRAVYAAEQAELRLADAKQVAREAQHAANAALVGGTTDTKNLTTEGKNYVEQLNTATDKVSDLKAKLGSVPKSKRTELKADIKEAEREVERLKKKIRDIKDKTTTINVRLTGGGTVRAIVDGTLTQFVVNAYGSIMKARPGGYLSTFAERGVDEAAIPIENTPNSVALWMETGRRILGSGNSGTSTSAATAAFGGGPTIQISGLEMNPDTIRMAVMQALRVTTAPAMG